MMDPVSERLHLPDPLVAIVGATDAPGKYGGIIYRDLKAKGYRVVGVNPGRTMVDGDVVYPDLASLPTSSTSSCLRSARCASSRKPQRSRRWPCGSSRELQTMPSAAAQRSSAFLR